MKNLSLLIGLMLSSVFYAQNLDIPDSTFIKLHSIRIIENQDTINLQVVYPKNYDKDKEYPIFLALAGGDQSLDITNYCYAAWFESHYFENHLTILPLSKKGGTLNKYKKEYIVNILNAIKNNFKITDDKWIIAGTSNGGNAVFKFIDVEPQLFEGAIVIPGILNKSISPSKKWSHLQILFAVGSKDGSYWKKGAKNSAKTLQKTVTSVKQFEMEGEEHIVKLSYDIDQVYDRYFKK